MSSAAQDDGVRNSVAVRLPTHDSQLEKLQAYLSTHGWTAAKRFLPKDDDELNDRLCRGEFAAVVFAEVNDALRMIWSGHGAVSRWGNGEDKRSIEIHFANGEATEREKSGWLDVLAEIERSHAAWDAERRRKQTIAGVILTVVALAAMGLLLWTRG